MNESNKQTRKVLIKFENIFYKRPLTASCKQTVSIVWYECFKVSSGSSCKQTVRLCEEQIETIKTKHRMSVSINKITVNSIQNNFSDRGSRERMHIERANTQSRARECWNSGEFMLTRARSCKNPRSSADILASRCTDSKSSRETERKLARDLYYSRDTSQFCTDRKMK